MTKLSKQHYLKSAALAGFGLIGLVHAAIDMVPATVGGSFKLTVTNNTAQPVNLDGIRFEAKGGKTFANLSDPMSGGVTVVPWNGKNFTEIKSKATDGGSQYSPGASKTAQHWNGNFKPDEFLNPIPMIKTGVCNQPDKPCDPPSLTVAELEQLLATSSYYDDKVRILDTLGIRGGATGGGLFDSYCSADAPITQFQIAIPTKDMTAFVNGQAARFDTTNTGKGPFLWMGFAANQEFFQLDYQWFIGKGRKETQLLTDMPYLGVNDGTGFTPFELEPPSFVDRMVAFKQFFPHQSCVQSQNYGDALAGSCGMSQTALAAQYMGPAGGPSHTDKPWIFNEVFMSGLYMYSVYDLLAASTNLGFKQLIENSYQGGDPKAPLCLMAAIYNKGPGSQNIIDQMKPKADGGKLEDLLDNPNACKLMETGFGNYTTQIIDGVNMMSNASRKAQSDPSIAILDRWISIDDLKAFYFGEGGDVSTPELKMQGGVLLNFKLTADQKKALWDELQQAFELQAKHWPLYNGKKVISLRYDWLSNLRIGKKYLARERAPMGNAWLLSIVKANSSKGVSIDGNRVDDQYPFASFGSPVINDQGFKITLSTDEPRTNDRGVSKVEWTLAPDWSNFTSEGVKLLSGGDPKKTQFDIQVPKSDLDAVAAAGGGNLHVRATDQCGNAIVLSTELNGPRLPKLVEAVITDTDGDGRGDKIRFEGQEYQGQKTPDFKFADFGSVKYQWPDATRQFQKNKSEITLNANSGFLNDTSLTHISDEAALSGSLALLYGSIELKTPIRDSIGPVILSAGMREKANPSDLDSLILNFSRDIAVQSNDQHSLLYRSGANPKIDPIDWIQKTPRQWIFVYPSGSFKPGQDSTWINELAGVIAAKNGQHAASNNRHVPIQLWKGALLLADDKANGFYDENGDGIMDRLRLKFQQEPDAGRLANLKAQVSWFKKSKAAKGVAKTWQLPGENAQIEGNGVISWTFAPSDSIQPGLTWFDGKTWGKVSVEQPEDLLSDKKLVQDAKVHDHMSPVINSAELKRASNPDQKPDYVSVNFSEPLPKNLITADNLYLYKVEDREISSYPHSKNLEWKSNEALRVLYTPELRDRPNLGDSIRLAFDPAQTGIIRDSIGNFATPSNPFRLLRGNPSIQFFSSRLMENIQSKSDSVFMNWQFADGKGRADSIIAAGGKSGIGVRFVFADSSQTSEERKQVELFYDVMIYDQIGTYVASTRGSLNCIDIQNGSFGAPKLADACNPAAFGPNREISAFLPWNMRSQDGARVGTGPYIFRASAWTANGSKTLLKKESIDITLGVVRPARLEP